MAFRLTGATRSPKEWGSLLEGPLACYDTLGDPGWDYDRDELLHERSAYELVRDQLTLEQQAELDQVDAHWRANAKEFNGDFALWHHQEDKRAALAGFVEDGDGDVPPIPRSHWWWRPLENDV